MSRLPPPASRPLDELWKSPALTWIVVGGEGLAAALALTPGITAGIGRWDYFAVASLWIQWVLLASLGTLYLARNVLNRLPPIHVGAIALVTNLFYCWVITAAGRWYFGDALLVDWQELGLFSSAVTLVVGLLGLATFENHRRGQQMALRAKQAELEALQARIRPHFLFNTLNTGAALVHARPGEAERLLLDLADLFRAALAGPHEISLADELSLARRYLEIEALRFGPRLQLHWHLPETLPDVTVPALSIQPLVENAIRHGVEPAAGGGRIDVSVQAEPGGVRVVVSNDLPPAGAPLSPGHHVGLASARERIEAMTGGRGRLETGAVGGRYVATVHLPTDATG